jgi:DNA-binding CsgD family transcriptional regulator
MTDADADSRQRRQDKEYARACREHGIEPEPAVYRATGFEDRYIDRVAFEDEGIRHNGSTYTVVRDDAPPEPLTPEAEGAGRLLELLMPQRCDPATFVKTAGRRCLALAWLLGKRPESLAELGRALGISRASLSVYVRGLETKLGFHGRGQKRASARPAYQANARRIWKTRRLDALMSDALAE